jgi:flagellar L-ring protein precursor FlgH
MVGKGYQAILSVAAAVIWTTGCMAPQTMVVPAQPQAMPLQPAAAAPEPVPENSLWRDNGPLSSLFANQKARRVGDIITVKIVEASKAANNANTQTGRQSSIAAGIDHFFNLESKFPPTRPGFSPFGSVKGSMSNDFDGTGTTERSGNLTAQMTVRVTEVMANGNLRIMGAREITVNHERQTIVLTGMVRARDVSADNEVLSTYIADAQIAYSGSGIVMEKQQPGWMARIFDVIWPF